MAGNQENPPPFVAASDRNKQPILEQLTSLFPDRFRVLEVGSGWGQHAVHFCRQQPGWEWQPSDRSERISELERQLAREGNPSIKAPMALNVLKDGFPAGPYDAVYSANTAHIMSWQAVRAMFGGAGECLAADGLFCLYGPFNIDGRYTSPGNEEFDQDLRAQNPERGLRDAVELESLAGCHQMNLVQRISMPANNLLLVFRKQAC